MHFEKVKRFQDIDLPMPVRKTANSAGYDFVVAEDIIVPSYFEMYSLMFNSQNLGYNFFDINEKIKTLDEISQITKSLGAKPSLVSTGMKCMLASNKYLELSVRSSCPLKNWLILANGVGIIDADYYNNPQNEGEIFFQLINLTPFDIQLKRGDTIGQGIIKSYEITSDDNATGQRIGGFGSTSV